MVIRNRAKCRKRERERRSSGRMWREPRLSERKVWGFHCKHPWRVKTKQLLNHFTFSMPSPCFYFMDVSHTNPKIEYMSVQSWANRHSAVSAWEMFFCVLEFMQCLLPLCPCDCLYITCITCASCPCEHDYVLEVKKETERSIWYLYDALDIPSAIMCKT